jgi:hypothetical protein
MRSVHQLGPPAWPAVSSTSSVHQLGRLSAPPARSTSLAGCQLHQLGPPARSTSSVHQLGRLSAPPARSTSLAGCQLHQLGPPAWPAVSSTSSVHQLGRLSAPPARSTSSVHQLGPPARPLREFSTDRAVRAIGTPPTATQQKNFLAQKGAPTTVRRLASCIKFFSPKRCTDDCTTACLIYQIF